MSNWNPEPWEIPDHDTGLESETQCPECECGVVCTCSTGCFNPFHE